MTRYGNEITGLYCDSEDVVTLEFLGTMQAYRIIRESMKNQEEYLVPLNAPNSFDRCCRLIDAIFMAEEAHQARKAQNAKDLETNKRSKRTGREAH